jgi:hypothetical protein
MPKRLSLVALRVSLLATLAWMASSGRAADAILDFRTLIPGIVDAPVYRADGTNRVRGEELCFAQLWAGASSNALAPLGPVLQFGEDQLAGYVWDESAIPVVVPLVEAGERVWVQMQAWEVYHGVQIPENIAPLRFYGESLVFSLVVSNNPTPLVGLRPFSFRVPLLQISRQGSQGILRWSAGDGTVYYQVQATAGLGAADSWRDSGLTPVLDRRSWPDGSGFKWEADWVVTNVFTEPTVFYRIHLLNP